MILDYMVGSRQVGRDGEKETDMRERWKKTWMDREGVGE